MNKELAMRTIGYLIGYYKTHDETTINSQEIEAIEYLDKENTNLKQALNTIRDKLLTYGETFDSDIHKQFQKECLEIIEKVGNNND